MSSRISIPFACPHIGSDEIEAIQSVINSRWLTTGKESIAFEKEFAALLNTPNVQALAVQSCTAGLHLAYKALLTKESPTVIACPLTFISTVSPAVIAGAKIAFIDCAPNSLYPNAESLDRLTPHYSQQILTLVPLGGFHPFYRELFAIAEQRGLHTIEDAAHALPAVSKISANVETNDAPENSTSSNTMPYGAIGDIGVYSFYANKTITTGEGGMIVSKNQALINTMNLLRNHGINRVTWDRYSDRPEQFSYDITSIGYKYNLPDILACIGRVQLRKASAMQAIRTQIAKHYTQRLSKKEYLVLPEHSENPLEHSWHLYIIQITHPRLSRDDFMKKLSEKGIGTSVHYTPLHVMSYFRDSYGYKPQDFPNALAMFNKILSIPIYPDLSMDDVEYISNAIIEIGDNH